MDKKIQAIHLLRMCDSAFDGVNAGGICIAVAKDIRKMSQVVMHGIMRACEQMAQVMGKHLAAGYPCLAAQLFHALPDIDSMNWPTGPCGEHGTGLFFVLFQVTG